MWLWILDFLWLMVSFDSKFDSFSWRWRVLGNSELDLPFWTVWIFSSILRVLLLRLCQWIRPFVWCSPGVWFNIFLESLMFYIINEESWLWILDFLWLMPLFWPKFGFFFFAWYLQVLRNSELGHPFLPIWIS